MVILLVAPIGSDIHFHWNVATAPPGKV
jgi:hypothetical protein